MADPLATLDDYVARYGAVDDPVRIVTLLDDASSKAREAAHLTISRVVDDELTVIGDGHTALLLPEIPVESVSTITVDGIAPAATDWRLRPGGILQHRAGGWTYDVDIAITYTHGWDPVPDWIIGLVCGVVQRAVRPAALAAVASESVGGQSTTYVATGLGANVWLTRDELAALGRILGPTVL